MVELPNTSVANYFLEEMFKSAADRLIMINPFLKLNDRMKELLADKARLKSVQSRKIGISLQSNRGQAPRFLR